MNSLLSLGASVLLLTSACGIGGGGRAIGTGPLVDNDRMLTAFDEISNETSADLTVTFGETQRVTVNAQADVQPILKTEIKGDRLTITADKNFDGNAGTNIVITVAELENFASDGSGNATISGFDGNKLQVAIDGSGDLEVRESKFDNLDLDLDGSGHVRFGGKGNDLKIKSNGSGDVDAYDWNANDVVVQAKGSGNVRVNADNKLDVKLSGSGNVYYRGNPDLQLEDDGSGEVKADN